MKSLKRVEELIKLSIVGNYPDNSLEFAIALALYRGGVKKITFGSYGPKSSQKANFNSITATPYVELNNRPLLWEVLGYFDLRASGGASNENKTSYMQSSFLFNNHKGELKYFKGSRYSAAVSEKEILCAVYAYFYWLVENGESKNFKYPHEAR